MAVGEVQTISLSKMMSDKSHLWDNIIVPKYNLQPYKFTEVVAWPFGDFVFGCDYDIMSSTVKSHQHGFTDCLDSEDMLIDLLRQFRRDRIVP
jgi:hypothetical protein